MPYETTFKNVGTAVGSCLEYLPKGSRIARDLARDGVATEINGANRTWEIIEIVGARVAYLKGGSPSCDVDGVTGAVLKRAGISVIRVL